MANPRNSLRQHLPFLIFMPLIIILMTWPTVIRIFDRDSFWLTRANTDNNMLFWDAWYFERWITGRADFYYTDLLFHPEGVSLAFHNFSLPHMAVMAALKTILPPANAFNLTFLVLIFLNAAAGYVYLYYLFRDKWVAFFGTVVFGATAFITARPGHTNIYFIATAPLSLYFLHRGLLEDRMRFMLSAGFLVGVTAFIGMYTLVCLLIMLCFYLIYFAFKRWNQLRFWQSVVIMLIVTGAFIAARFYPMLLDSHGLSSALSKHRDFEVSTDLLRFFFNPKHPVIYPLLTQLLPFTIDIRGWPNVVFLGYVPLLLVVVAFAKSKSRRRLLPWLILVLPFLVLRLGSVLRVNGVDYPDIILPKYFLTQAFPHLFQPFWATENFHAGILFPFAVLTCFGLVTMLKSLPAKHRHIVVLLLAGIVAYEYYHRPSPQVISSGRFDVINWLQLEDNQESIHLIHLPMGGQYSKVYGFYQTFSGYPHAEGRPTRTPSSAFDYIEGNLLLSNWRAGKVINCLPGNQADFAAAQEQLLADGFTHVVMNHYLGRKELVSQFVNVSAAYHDEFVDIYRVDDLYEICSLTAFLSPVAISHLRDIDATAIVPWQKGSLLIIDPVAASDRESTANVSSVLYSVHGFSPLLDDDIRDGLREDKAQSAPEGLLARNDVILLTYDPGVADPARLAMYRNWIASHFISCGRLADTDETVIEYYLRKIFPCELALSNAPLTINYDNGMQLGNMLANVDEYELEVSILWKRLPSETHAISVQLFDENDTKTLGQDFVFRADALNHYQIDLSTLAPGTYIAKLIVYNYETGASVPGTVVSSQTRFDRELELNKITVES